MGNYTSGLDLQYRPASYFWAKEKGIGLLSDIKGAERRRIYANALKADDAQSLPPELTQDVLSEKDRRDLGRFHPAFMGGEYLPTRKSVEVEIARITIASTTQDVTCVYARQVGQRIHYRVVDEYEGDTLKGEGIRTSIQPLELQELVDFFLASWDLIGCLDCNFEDDGHPRSEIHDFIVDASSSFYAEFDDLVRARVDEWLDSIRRDEDGE
ncbi:MAG: hypothetical protein WBI20_15150 [Burkholderiaceae bacterium]